MKHNLETYLNDFNTLTPTDAQVGTAVANSEWWTPLKNQFDDLIWLYWPDRTIFVNDRFDPEDKANTYANLIKSFSIFLKSKKRQFDRLYNVIMMDYNPLWNVDGVTGTVSEDKHTGTDTAAKTGTDTSGLSGSDTTRQSGSDIYAQSGSDVAQASGTDTSESHLTKDETTRTGSQAVAGSGTDVNSHGVFTFDDTTNSKPSAIDSTEYGKTETTTYNSLKDAHLSDGNSSATYGRRDQTTYGKTDTATYGKADTTSYGKQDQMVYNNTTVDTRNLKDEHVDMVIRQGNIGVTTSQSMATDELKLWTAEYSDFFKTVVHMCVNQVSYGVEGVF